MTPRPPRHQCRRPRPAVRARAVLVELQERVLQAGRLDRQVGDRQTRDRREERPDVALELAPEAPVDDHDVGDARDAARAWAEPAIDPHLHRPAAPGQERADLLEGDQAPAPHDRDPVADPLDLGQDVRGEEDGPARRPQLVEDLVEGTLHQGVQALRGLVEDGELRVVLERLDDPELLAHPAAVVADRAGEVARGELEAIEEPRPQDRRAAVERPEVVEEVDPGHRVVEGDPARAGSRPGPGSPRRRPRCPGRARAPRRPSGGGTPGAA